MSIRLQNDVNELAARLAKVEAQLAEALALLRAITRAGTPKGRAA